MHPLLGYFRMHKGMDIGAPYGSPIYAAIDGVVRFAGRSGGYGNFVKLAHPGTVIVLDNVIRGGAIVTESGDPRVAAVKETLQIMGAHPRLDTAALQTVGSKGWDGFAIAVVR